MKKITTLFACLLAACPAAFAQTSYLENITVENRVVEKDGSNVRVSMDLDLGKMDIKSQHSLSLVPTLVSADGAQECALKPIVVNGSVRNRVMERQQALGNLPEDTPADRVRRRNGKAQTISYEDTAPFSRWMVNGRLELRGYVTGCAMCDEGDENIATGGVLPYTEPTYIMAFVQPKEEEVKRRAEVKTARLQYRQDSYNIRPDYKNNRAELDTVQKSIDAVKDNRNLTITGIYITGYASPEASVAYNMQLSKNRAQTFAAYIQKNNPELKKSLWHVAWKGEDWEGLREQVANCTTLLRQKDVLKIIDECDGNQDACEARIKALVPPDIYQRILNELYGPLRRNEYRIEYNVRHFDLEEAKQLLKSRPDLLSVAEIQKVADSYGRNTPQYKETMNIAARTYPDNVAALNNAALAEFETGNYSAAISLLKNTEDPALLNILGAAYAKAGNKDKAEQAFKEAVRKGNTQAGENLRMLQESRKYD